jgi:hypothetical protein
MNCSQIRMLLPSFDNNELSETEQKAVFRHLTNCAGCRSALENIRSLHERLSLLQNLTLNTEISDTIISRIRWRSRDTRAPEESMDTMDKLSSYNKETEKSKESGPKEEPDINPTTDNEGHLIPDWKLRSEP